MKKFLLLMLFMGGLSFVQASTHLLSATENGHSYQVMKITLDGSSKIVVSVIDSGSPAQSLQALMNTVGGTHALNGAFFCPKEAAYARCVGNTTDGLRISNGVLYSKRGKDIGENKSVFGFDAESNVLPMAERDGRYRANDGRENDALATMANGMMMPTLVKDGINVAILNTAMNTDAKQSKSANKTFICSTQDKKTIYMGYVDNVTFSSLADYIIQTFDCYNAIQLDNGGSKAMIYNNQYVAGPGRNIMDAFVIIEEPSQELKDAVAWMYEQSLTSKSTLSSFLPNNTMTREEAAKFFSVFATKIFQKTGSSSNDCTFSDISKADPSLVSSIDIACQLGIFKGSNGKFIPKDTLTNAQAITVLMRILVGTLEEPSGAFWSNYLTKAKELGLIEDISISSNITRGEAAALLWKGNQIKEKL